MPKKIGRPKIHKNITVSVMDDFNAYHRQYRKKVMKKKRKRKRK